MKNKTARELVEEAISEVKDKRKDPNCSEWIKQQLVSAMKIFAAQQFEDRAESMTNELCYRPGFNLMYGESPEYVGRRKQIREERDMLMKLAHKLREEAGEPYFEGVPIGEIVRMEHSKAKSFLEKLKDKFVI